MKLYFKVTSKRSECFHIKMDNTRSEGLTRCGRIVNKGWVWCVGRSIWDKPLCKQCYG